MALRAGAAFQLRPGLLLTSDVSLAFDDSLSLHFGGEYLYPSRVKGVTLKLRAGFKTAAMSYLGAMSAVSLGFGAETGALEFGYALSPYGDLGMSHRLDLKIKFDSLTAAAPEVAVRKDGKTVTRSAADLYRETMTWFSAKAAEEKLSQAEQDVILRRIIEKFSTLGVDVSEARQKLGGGQSAKP